MAEPNLPAVKDQAGTPAAGGRKTLRDMLEGELFKEQLAKALPKHLTPERYIRVVVTTMNRIPDLASCDQASFFGALLTLSQMGLEPDGRRAHLIPFRNNKKGITECQLIVDYKGIVELVMNTGEVSYIHADVVCENDDFLYDKGELKKHVINFRQDRGPMYAAYAMIRFKDGTEKVEVMNKAEIEAIRARSKTYDRDSGKSHGPWATDYNEMAKKTAFRRASKWVKLAPEQREVIEADDDLYAPVPDKTGAMKLGERLAAGASSPQEALPPAPEQPTGEGLAGARLALYEKVAEMAAGDIFEMNKILSNLSGGKIKDKEGLITAADDVVSAAIDKMGAKK